MTGCSGFVGYYFIRLLAEEWTGVDVLGIDFNQPNLDFDVSSIHFQYKRVNMMQQEEVAEILREYRPDYIIHLAAFSSVGLSWQSPVECFHNNTNIILYMLEAQRKLGLTSRLLSVGSSEEYGNVNKDQVPLREDHVLDPVSPYAVARVSQEILSKVYVGGYGLDIVMTRSFNHIGPRQKPVFVISSFAKQVAAMKLQGLTRGELTAGNTDIIRDFLDVRDVVRAYMLILLKGQKGEVYNVCSGEGHSLKQIIKMLGDSAGIEISINIDEKLIRPKDNMIIVGSNTKLCEEVEWKQDISIAESLEDILSFYYGC